MMKAVQSQWSSGRCFNHHLSFPKCLIISIHPGMLLDCANSYQLLPTLAKRVFCAMPQVCALPWWLCSLFGWCCPVWEGRQLSVRKHAVPHHMAAEQGSSHCLYYWATSMKSCVPRFSLVFSKSHFSQWVTLSTLELLGNQILVKKLIKIFLPSRDEIYFETATRWTIRKIQRS